MKRLFALALLSSVVLAACGSGGNGDAKSVTLTLGAYSTPQDDYAKIIPLFQTYWQQQQSGQSVSFKQSYQGSGAQARAIINGFEADVAVLSVSSDIDKIKSAGLITHDWTATPTHGFIYDSVVAFAVRQGNPKNIHDWADLAKPGVQILTPDAKSSGGAQWAILALYGAALRGEVAGVAKNDPAAARTFLTAVLKNVKAFDKDAQTSITNFENGVGDVAITYESSVLQGQKLGKPIQLVVPTSTILIQNPVAVVDVYVKKHGTQKVADAFVNFLTTPQAQQVFADDGQRVLDPTIAQQTASQHPQVQDLWDISFLGGWKNVSTQIFGTSGVYAQALAAAQQGK